MKLGAYLTSEKITVIDFAARIKRSRSTVYSILSGAKYPNAETQNKIIEETGGRVSAQDLLLTRTEYLNRLKKSVNKNKSSTRGSK